MNHYIVSSKAYAAFTYAFPKFAAFVVITQLYNGGPTVPNCFHCNDYPDLCDTTKSYVVSSYK